MSISNELERLICVGGVQEWYSAKDAFFTHPHLNFTENANKFKRKKL